MATLVLSASLLNLKRTHCFQQEHQLYDQKPQKFNQMSPQVEALEMALQVTQATFKVNNVAARLHCGRIRLGLNQQCATYCMWAELLLCNCMCLFI